MSLISLDGGWHVPVGPGWNHKVDDAGTNTTTLDAANEALICVGRMMTSDGASHTIDTTGSSSIQWKTGTSTFANIGTVVKVGLGTVDAGNGPPPRQTNVANLITYDVSKTMTGGGGGVTSGAWQTHVPDAGTKTIAPGNLVAFSVQMVTRGGADSVLVASPEASTAIHMLAVTAYTGGSYANSNRTPNFIVKFSDGAYGWMYGSEPLTSLSNRTWNSSSSPNEYGQLYKLPFPTKIYGLWGWFDPDGDCDVVLYSDPLGTPVAEKTVSLDANTMATANLRKWLVPFATPYTTTADQVIGAVYKPGASNVTTRYKTHNNADHRITDHFGADGYGISRSSGAFANANSSLDHYYIGLMLGAFDDGASVATKGIPFGGPFA